MTEQIGKNEYNPTRRRPAHRNRPNGGDTLASSFNQFVLNSSSAEIQEFSSQLTSALNSVSLAEDPAAGAGDPANDSSDGKENSNKLRESERRLSEGEFYAPQPTSRRNSKAGEQLVASMKQTAAELLAELGDLSDDDVEQVNARGLDTWKE
mmetsp:Transcript_13925/g.19779  ORF Transcript_13925/g.19779 Transcript_13925/m.19779 type:complete len:152 (+) Transcript_13925:144-599(+)|eukprot:CAMPEP_0201686898 /NCGR_PEP_ID=MMETSP0578-20130828/1174_1 /ASSEMBLY_ACC=CAM_ASM_000663 /TAXON_ID=267565 /ORGANISM="Skeletonema grethea, Strain CCMP 1804" /LENGTH=151 /DNA_ID=CAMNT_0048171003 /DNA_START=110 /DNA_END=565 /DNA_ORIENTATION=+